MASENGKQYMIWAFKLHGCADCGAKPVEAGGDLAMSELHCDHRDPASKRDRAHDAYRGMDSHGRGSLADQLRDLANCDCVCAECHKKRHRARRRQPHVGIQVPMFSGTGEAWKVGA